MKSAKPLWTTPLWHYLVKLQSHSSWSSNFVPWYGPFLLGSPSQTIQGPWHQISPELPACLCTATPGSVEGRLSPTFSHCDMCCPWLSQLFLQYRPASFSSFTKAQQTRKREWGNWYNAGRQTWIILTAHPPAQDSPSDQLYFILCSRDQPTCHWQECAGTKSSIPEAGMQISDTAVSCLDVLACIS